MSAFTGPLTVTELDSDTQLWRLDTALTYDIGQLGSGRSITVPVGFVTDGASVPRAFWPLIPPWGTYSRPAVMHDLLCVLLERGTPHPLAPTRRRADDIFFEAMGVTKTKKLVRWILWIGVRVGALIYEATGHQNKVGAANAKNATAVYQPDGAGRIAPQ